MNIRLTKYLALAAFSFILASCTDEDIINPTSQYRDGDLVTLSFNISVPEAEEVAVTRATPADENKIENLTLLVFSDNSDEGVLKQVYTSYKYDGEFSETGTMTNGTDDKHKKFTANVKASTSDKAIYILANAGYLLTSYDTNNFNLEIGKTTVGDLRNLQTYETPPKFIMSGCKVLPIPHADLLTQDFPLYRTHAKVTVDVAKSLKEDFQLEGFYLCNTQKNGSVVAYPLYGETTSTTTLPDATDNPNEDSWEYSDWLAFDEKMYATEQAQYPAPTANEAVSTDDKNTKLFLLIKGTYKGDTYYYHADFKTKEESPLDVLPNHHYQVTITKVDRIGYVHSDKGCKGAIDGAENLSVDIQDIEPTSHHMASDGVTEIGVESDTLYIEQRTNPNENGKVTFEVTVYPSINTDKATVNIDWGSASWLVSSNEDHKTEEKEVQIEGRSDKYSVTSVTLHTTVPNLAGEYREARVGISCRGVLCYVTVIDKPEFSAHEFGSVSLKVKEYERNENWEITNPDGKILGTYNDYWAFIRGIDTEDKLYGIQPKDMGGKIRTEGFHAPMSDYQQFVYTFKVPDSNDETFKDCTWHIELADDYQTNSEGKPFILFWTGDNSPASNGKPINKFEYHTKQKMNGQSFTFTNNLLDLQNDGKITENAYRYGEKAFRIVVTRPDGQELVFAYDLYHTGVFDYYEGKNEYEVGNQNILPGWYYYEVILMGSNYWLDRNLGATSASYYTKESNAGDLNAAGGLYRIAKNANNSPSLLSEEELEDIAPKGFRVPTMTEFQIMTQDHRFHHANEGSYWTNYYDTGKPEQGVVYFPHNGMWYNDAASGSGSTGYYWTQSQALGASGTERGWWLQNMQLAGSNASTNRYRIQASNTQNYTGMSVRCVYNSRRIETINTIEFYVKGYTHVFLYYQEPGSNNRTFLNAWPGDQIAVNEPASLNMYHTFKYESMMDYGYENLRVVFNVVNTDLTVNEAQTCPADFSTKGGLSLEEGKPFFSKSTTTWSDKAQ